MLASEEKVKLPISVTGTSSKWQTPASRPLPTHLRGKPLLQRGFTLWELLVVVAIVAITVSLLQFSSGLGDGNRELKRVGKNLGKLFHLLSQEAVFENRNYAISVQEQGFVVLEYRDGEWKPSNDAFFARIKMTDTQSSELLIDDKAVENASENTYRPDILILSSGEMTPFEWRISDRLTQSMISLQGDLLGRVLMTGPEPLG